MIRPFQQRFTIFKKQYQKRQLRPNKTIMLEVTLDITSN
jgi:hypothetical protein